MNCTVLTIKMKRYRGTSNISKVEVLAESRFSIVGEKYVLNPLGDLFTTQKIKVVLGICFVSSSSLPGKRVF